MTIRGGGGPRDEGEDGRREPMARRRDEPGRPREASPRTAGRSGTVTGYDMARSRRRSGAGNLVGFLIFVVIAAAVVLIALATVLRPLTRSLVVGLADANSGALGIPFVADFVREDLGTALTAPASGDATEVDFTVAAGETAAGIAGRLVGEGLLRDRRAFLLVAIERGVTGQLDVGTFMLRRNLTPAQLVATLLEAKDPSFALQFRTGLRLEQMTAYLQARPPEIATLQMDAKDFLTLARNPPKELLDSYPWLDLPEGASLQGYLAAGGYRVLPDTTAEELIRKMLDRFYANVGGERIQAAKESGRSFHEVLTLASIVERETSDNAERAPVAGVFVNRMKVPNETAGLLGSDPTVFYANDSFQLSKLALSAWPQYSFWAPPEGGLSKDLPADLAAYNTYKSKGLPPGPICTPTVASIDGALAPDTTGGYLYFFATKAGTTVFAKTYAEHQQNIKKDAAS